MKRVIINGLLIMPFVALLNPFELGTISNASIRAIDLLFLVIGYIIILYLIANGKYPKRAAVLLHFIFFLITISFFGDIFLPFYEVRWANFIRFIQTLLWGLFGSLVVVRRLDLRRLLCNVLAASSIISVYSLYLFLTIPELHRVAGWFSFAGGEGLDRQASYNEIGALSALAAAIALHGILFKHYEQRPKFRFFLFVAFILNIVGVVLTQSRSAILGLVLAVFILLVPDILRLFSRWKLSKRLLATLIFGIATIVFVLPSMINRFTSSFMTGSAAYESILVRFILWQDTFNYWTENIGTIFYGIGYASMDRYLIASSAHNFFLNITLSFGIFGMIAVLAILMIPVRACMRIGGECSQLALIVFIVAVTVSFTGNVLVDPFYGGITFMLLYSIHACYSRHYSTGNLKP